MRAMRWSSVGSPSAIGNQLLGISYRPSAISYRPSAISYQPSAISYRPSAISYQPSAISHQLSGLFGHCRPSLIAQVAHAPDA
jgi:hypothetical protein